MVFTRIEGEINIRTEATKQLQPLIKQLTSILHLRRNVC